MLIKDNNLLKYLLDSLLMWVVKEKDWMVLFSSRIQTYLDTVLHMNTSTPLNIKRKRSKHLLSIFIFNNILWTHALNST